MENVIIRVQVAMKEIHKKIFLKKEINFFLCQRLKSRVSFTQQKPILDIFLSGFSLSSCPQHSLTVSPLALESHVSYKVVRAAI
jgi:transcription initiation factor IIE alpha subunit